MIFIPARIAEKGCPICYDDDSFDVNGEFDDSTPQTGEKGKVRKLFS